jgi:radical SAM superfamily enzyme YgiQ (UPF0313 family)
MVTEENYMQKIALINPLTKYFDRMSNNFIMPRYGTIAVGSALKNAGYDVRIFSEFIKSEINWDYVYSSDCVCFAVMSFCANRAYELACKVKRKIDVPIIFGGAHPTVLPEECLQYCDYVVRNEGEDTLLELLDHLKNGKDVAAIEGISYKIGSNKMVHNKNRKFSDDFDFRQDVALMANYDTVGPACYGKSAARHYMQVIQTSRGCPFNCKFCVAPKELGIKYRTKRIETVLSDIENGINHTHSTNFMIVDNEFTVNRKRTRKLLRAIADRFKDTLYLMVFARSEVGGEPEILELMRKAGIKLLFVGVESVNEDTLKHFRKKQTLNKVCENIRNIHAAGIATMGSSILGSEYDTPDKILDTWKFFIDNNFSHAQFYSIYEIPTKQKVLGLPQLFADNRFIHHDWRFFTSGYVVHYPKFMKPSTLQKIIVSNYRNFYSRENMHSSDPLAKSAYSRLGFWLRMVNPEIMVAQKYIPFLEEFEKELYDENEHLMESRLPADADTYPYQRQVPIDLSDLDDKLF